MKEVKLGDVYEIETSKGKAYFQYVYKNDVLGELIRVFPYLFKEIPDMNQIINLEKYYYIHFPLTAAKKQKIVSLIENFNVPSYLELPPNKMRSKVVDKEGNFKTWQIIDYQTWGRENVKVLSDEQKKLSPWGAWNDTLLITRLEEGWSPEEWK